LEAGCAAVQISLTSQGRNVCLQPHFLHLHNLTRAILRKALLLGGPPDLQNVCMTLLTTMTLSDDMETL